MLGMCERERFYQAYQIWFLRETVESDFTNDGYYDTHPQQVNSAIERFVFEDYYNKSFYQRHRTALDCWNASLKLQMEGEFL